MDKDMISIDDLVKQKLSGGEEKERTGAWLSMRDLLDAQMPVTVAAVGFNWRRIFTYFTGVVFVGTMAVGGYKALKPAVKSNKTIAVATHEANPATSINSKPALANTPSIAKTSFSANNTQPKTTIKNKADIIKSGLSIQNSGNNNNHNSLIISKNTASDNSNSLAKNTVQNKTNSNNHTFGSGANNNKQLPESTVKNNAGKPNNQKASESIPPAVAANSSIVSGGNIPTVTSRPSRPGQPQDPHITNPRYVDRTTMDSAEMIKVKESTRRGQTITTTTHEMVPRPKSYALPETEENFTANPPVAATITGESYTMKDLRDSKVGSKWTGSGNNGNLLEEMVQNAKVTLGNVTFHPGLMAGVSSSVGAYRMTGVQGGVVGMMNVSDRIMMFAELKFIYRFGNGRSLYNNFNKLRDSSYVGNGTFRYDWDSVEHYYNITNSSSIELPIGIKYSMKRTNIFLGVNTAYNMAVGVYEKSTANPREYYSSGNSSGLTSQWNEKDNTIINTNDFRSRFTVGYMLGVGYQVSPAVGLDLRVTQPLWDNLRTKGAYQVSKELYRSPSFQFNMTYRLSNNKYRQRNGR